MIKINKNAVKNIIKNQVKKNKDLIYNAGVKDKENIKYLLKKIEDDFLSENDIADKIENQIKDNEIILENIDLDEIKELRAAAMHKILNDLKETYFFQRYLVDFALNHKNFYIEYCFKNDDYKLIFETKNKNIFVKHLTSQDLQNLDDELEEEYGYYCGQSAGCIQYLINKFSL